MGKSNKRRRDSSESSDEDYKRRSKKNLKREIRSLKQRLGERHSRTSFNGEKPRATGHSRVSNTTGSSSSRARPRERIAVSSISSSNRPQVRERSHNRTSCDRSISRSQTRDHLLSPLRSSSSDSGPQAQEHSHARLNRVISIDRPQAREFSIAPSSSHSRQRAQRHGHDDTVQSSDHSSEGPDQDIIEVNKENLCSSVNEEETIDAELLKLLGEDKENIKTFEIHTIFKNRWEIILNRGLPKEEKHELLSKHSIPSNLTALNAPDVNPEIGSAIPENAIKNDKFQRVRQNQLGKAISALGAAGNLLLKSNNFGDIELRNNLLILLSETGKILNDLHYRMSITRRAIIAPHLNKTVRGLISEEPVGELLFGPNLGEKIKAAKAVERSGKELKQSSTIVNTYKNQNQARGSNLYRSRPISQATVKESHLNFRGPSRYRREPRTQGQYPQKIRKVSTFRNRE